MVLTVGSMNQTMGGRWWRWWWWWSGNERCCCEKKQKKMMVTRWWWNMTVLMVAMMTRTTLKYETCSVPAQRRDVAHFGAAVAGGPRLKKQFL